ncbi:MAG: hypothetical protein V3S69_02340, partial [Dehalococcoidales bacterium]
GNANSGIDGENIGTAKEGSGKVTFHNDQDYWSRVYDKYYFENKQIDVFSWSRKIPLSEAKKLYKGKISAKSWSKTAVSFSIKDPINELREPMTLPEMSEVSGARLTERLKQAKQRRVYGYLTGMRPTNIDAQLEDGYPLTGTTSITGGSDILTGTGSLFLKELSPGDEININGIDENVTIKAVTSDTSATLSEEAVLSTAGDTSIFPKDRGIPYANREWFLTHHPISEHVYTVVNSFGPSYFTLSSVLDIRVGSTLLINGELAQVRRVLPSNNGVRLETNLSVEPGNGDSVTVVSVTGVKIDDNELQYIRDYTYNADDSGTARLTLTELAEFNIAATRSVNGTLDFTSGSNAVTGTGTSFDTQLKPGDWIRSVGQSDYFEVLSVDSETSLLLRSDATYTSSANAQYKSPAYYTNEAVLSCNLVGRTDDNTTSGRLIKNAPMIISDIIDDIGLASDKNVASFTDNEDIVPQLLGMVIPEDFDDNSTQKSRTIINRVNKSVFSSVIMDVDYKLKFTVINPSRPADAFRIREDDDLGFSIQSKSDKISSKAIVSYDRREYDPESKSSLFPQKSGVSNNALYLAKTDREFGIETVLVREIDAEIYAARWAFLFEASASFIKFKSKMQLSQLEVNDVVDLDHRKLYERIGSNSKRKFMAVQQTHRSHKDTQLEMLDLSNSLSRCGIITDNVANDYDGS